MHNPQNSQVNALLVIVSLLAVVGGLAIVVVTSPQSLQLSQYNLLPPRATEPFTATPTPPATDTPLPPTAEFVLAATSTDLPTASPTAANTTAVPSSTSTPSTTPTFTVVQLTSVSLPPDVRALAVVSPRVGAQTVRIRDLPNGAKLVQAVSGGTQLEVLFGQAFVGGLNWVEVRLRNNRTGWIAANLITITFERPPGTGTAGPPPTENVSAANTDTPVPPPPNNTAPPGDTAPPIDTATSAPTLTPAPTLTSTPSGTPVPLPTTTPPGATATNSPGPITTSTHTPLPTNTPEPPPNTPTPFINSR